MLDATSKTPSWSIAEDDPQAILMAKRYVWRQSPQDTLQDLSLLFAQMMAIGVMEDIRWLLSVTTEDDLRQVLRDPPIGFFNERAWHFWHHRLGVHPIPKLPKRTFTHA